MGGMSVSRNDLHQENIECSSYSSFAKNNAFEMKENQVYPTCHYFLPESGVFWKINYHIMRPLGFS